MGHPRGRPLLGRSLLASLLVLAGCNAETQLGRGTGRLRVERTEVDFGRVFVGLAPIEATTIRNLGVAPLQVELQLVGETEGYAFGPPDAVLGPGGSLDVQVLFRPRRAGLRDAVLRVVSDAPGASTATIALSAMGVDVPDCEDGNGCTVDTFNIETERCVHTAESLPCNDFSVCTASDTCVEGICRGSNVDCDDGDSCTDDACDPEAGCVHIPTGRCDDGNPCTRDICDPDGGCRHEQLSDGFPCDDAEQCTSIDVCFRGVCRGVDIPEGTPCDDGDPCSLAERCISGECQDPSYTPPNVGEVAFTATVAAVGPGAAENVIVDRNDTAYFGTATGIAAVDQCGEMLWTNDEVGTPAFWAAVSLPGILTVPVEGRLFDIDSRDGSVIRSLDVDTALPVVTASTATVTTRILDVAVRNSGALVASAVRTVTTTAATATAGYLIEVDALHTTAMRMRDLGPQHASRVALDLDESVVAILRDGAPTATRTATVSRGERVVRLGIEGVADGTWSSFEVATLRSDLALGEEGEVLWAAGFTRIDRRGQPTPFIAPPNDPQLIRSGSPVTGRDVMYVVIRRPPETNDRLVALTSTDGPTRFDLELPGPTIQHSPAVDAAGRVYVVTADATLVIVSPAGDVLVQAALPLDATPLEGVALTLTTRGNLLIAAGDRLLAVKGLDGLANSSWPRHRRDNLSTSHR